MKDEKSNDLLQMEPARIEDAELEPVAGGRPPIHYLTHPTIVGVTVCCWG
jgi:hypothetical protein